MAEAVLIFLLMHTIDKRFPFVIQALEATEINPKIPIKYRLGAPFEA